MADQENEPLPSNHNRPPAPHIPSHYRSSSWNLSDIVSQPVCSTTRSPSSEHCLGFGFRYSDPKPLPQDASKRVVSWLGQISNGGSLRATSSTSRFDGNSDRRSVSLGVSTFADPSFLPISGNTPGSLVDCELIGSVSTSRLSEDVSYSHNSFCIKPALETTPACVDSPSRTEFTLLSAPSFRLCRSGSSSSSLLDMDEARALFMSNKPLRALTGTERSNRHRNTLSDPFGHPHRHRLASLDVPILPAGFASSRPGRHRLNHVLRDREDATSNSNRIVSVGAIWNVGGSAVATGNTPNIAFPVSGGIISHASAAPRYTSRFLEGFSAKDEFAMHEKRLALALGIDRANRVIGLEPYTDHSGLHQAGGTCLPQRGHQEGLLFRDNKWMHNGGIHRMSHCLDASSLRLTLHSGPKASKKLRSFLEAPDLRDDFYCSVLAYSCAADRLAVALGSMVYLWSEHRAVIPLPPDLHPQHLRSAYVTSLAFSSEQGGRGVLAVARGDGSVALWSPLDEEPRYLKLTQATAAAHVSFRPTTIRCASQRHPSFIAETEVMLVGDDIGAISVYFVEWPKKAERFLFGWNGGISLHARVYIHTQQICGISWSPDGDFFASGANDNVCSLVETGKILHAGENGEADAADLNDSILFGRTSIRHQWTLKAAVKAMAFCPWQRGLIAIGGGSNDRCIHFHHTISGVCLATIDCAAQVTSLTWSTSKREIAATLGFAQPEHPFRIAVYSWPTCQQVVAIPWQDDMRALSAVPYPRGSGMKHGMARLAASRRKEEGCLVVAASDGSIKFHDIWCDSKNTIGPHQGIFGGSAILESLHGIEQESMETIR
ncbi:hypothetical protein FH972_022352 [Carpinus fangiana]|uniref:Anaphase-promoting complex subunit 4 WD40 domain-containing protein n=1 Tax=Carpinus fangiana TaxID=176857 RepID=A0A5N6KS09_9ROSI|nr:hypothetical protein FH972_022352 [Carpinus fangiana]